MPGIGMPALSYSEKLKDPRWQKKRLEILQRADFKCEDCGASDKTLHVHHGYYERGHDPWEYNEASLHCLCEECHESAQEALRDIHWEVAQVHPANLVHILWAIANRKEELAQVAVESAVNSGMELSLNGDRLVIGGHRHPGVLRFVLESRRDIVRLLKRRLSQEQGSTDGTDPV